MKDSDGKTLSVEVVLLDKKSNSYSSTISVRVEYQKLLLIEKSLYLQCPLEIFVVL